MPPHHDTAFCRYLNMLYGTRPAFANWVSCTMRRDFHSKQGLLLMGVTLPDGWRGRFNARHVLPLSTCMTLGESTLFRYCRTIKSNNKSMLWTTKKGWAFCTSTQPLFFAGSLFPMHPLHCWLNEVAAVVFFGHFRISRPVYCIYSTVFHGKSFSRNEETGARRCHIFDWLQYKDFPLKCLKCKRKETQTSNESCPVRPLPPFSLKYK